jgi:predicted RNase H-like nuclease (RuvC/YqgF family)
VGFREEICAPEWSVWVQAEEETVAEKQAQNRAKLKQEERMVHKLQKERVSLNSSLADKKAELAALQHNVDPEKLEEMQTEMASVERSIKERNEDVKSHRKRLSSLQAKQEKEQEVLEVLQRRLV